MQAITVSNLRSRIKYYLNLVAESSEVLIIPRTNNDDAVVILSLKEYNALTETNYLLSSETNRKRLLESIQQIENNELIKYELGDDPGT
ncbi:MAG: type II toxin-antitoxin system Phd/YefM family antitoxin [Cyclobacteriaceae bacterium]